MARYALICSAPYTVGSATAPAGTKIQVIILDDPSTFAVPDGFTLQPDDGTPIWTAAIVLPVPQQVANASARRVMQQNFVPDGRSFYTVVNAYLQSQVTATASLADNTPQKIQALGAWTQWDMGNMFLRADPLIAAMGQVITAAGGTVDLDALFRQAGQL